jgi:hypothetical protein
MLCTRGCWDDLGAWWRPALGAALSRYSPRRLPGIGGSAGTGALIDRKLLLVALEDTSRHAGEQFVPVVTGL